MDISPIRSHPTYKEHLASARAQYQEMRAKIRRRRLISFPIAIALSALLAHSAVNLKAPWATTVLHAVHGDHVLPVIIILGMGVICYRFGKVYMNLLELQSELSTLLTFMYLRRRIR